MPENRNAHTASAGNEALEIVLRGVTIRLKFTAKQNEEKSPPLCGTFSKRAGCGEGRPENRRLL